MHMFGCLPYCPISCHLEISLTHLYLPGRLLCLPWQLSNAPYSFKAIATAPIDESYVLTLGKVCMHYISESIWFLFRLQQYALTMCSPRVLTNRGLKAFLTQEPPSDGITTGHVQHTTLPYHTPHVTTSPKKQLSCSEPSSLETLHLPPGGDTASPQSSFLKATTHLGSCSFSLASFHIPIYVEFFLLSSLLTYSVSPLSTPTPANRTA